MKTLCTFRSLFSAALPPLALAAALGLSARAWALTPAPTLAADAQPQLSSQQPAARAQPAALAPAPAKALPQALPDDAPAAAPAIHTATLANGLTVIVKPDHRAPTAVHMLWLKVGAFDEVDGKTGLAHLLEHMMFKGTATLGPGEFSRRVAALGGRENAFTGMDYTAYFQQIPAARLGEVMALEADRLATNRWSDDEFRKELEVVKEERRLRTDDNPRALLYEALNATAFVANPNRRPIVGWMHDLDGLQPDDARAFYQRWYVPANAALVVVGDVQPAQVLALAEQTYGRIAARPAPARARWSEPPQQAPKAVEVQAPAEQAVVVLGFKVPHLRTLAPADAAANDALALTVLAAVLDGYSGARLEQALTQSEPRLADSVDASYRLTGRGPQLFTLSGVPAKGQTPDAVATALRAQVARIAREGVSQAELHRVKTQWVASETYKRDSIMAQAQELGSHWAQGLPPDISPALIARLQQVSAAQVQSVAQRYFDARHMTTATLQPQPIDPSHPPRTEPPGVLR